MAPPPAWRRAGRAARDTRNVPRRLMSTTRSQSASLVCSAVPTRRTPALLTTTLSLPNRLTVSPRAASTCPRLETSQATAQASPPERRISSETFSSGATRRPATATCAPSRAKRMAQARPIPVPPPVRKATLPASLVTASPPFTSKLVGRAEGPECSIGGVPGTRCGQFPGDPATDYAHRHHLLSHIRRLRSRDHGAWHGAGRARPRSALHQLRAAHSPGPFQRTHSLSRSGSGFLSPVRPPALRPGAFGEDGRSGPKRRPRPAARSLRHPAFRERAAGANDGRAEQAAVHHHLARHGHHSGGARPQLSADYAILDRAERRRHLCLALSEDRHAGDIWHPEAHRSDP